jgi:hypothetical protein
MVRVRRARAALGTTNLGYPTMRKIPQRIFQVCSGAAVLLSLCRVAFADASARLVYVRGAGAEQCPGEQALRAAASARLGYDAFFPWAHDTLFVEITSAGGIFRIGIKLVGEDSLLKGAREIVVKEDDCAAVVDAMALTMSLVIDPASVAGAGPSRSVPEAPALSDEPKSGTDPEPPPAASESSVDATPTISRSALHGRAGAGAAGTLHSAPAVALGVTAFVGIVRGSLSVDVEGRYDLPATGDSLLPGVRVQSSLAAVALVPCLYLDVFFGCAVASAGSLTATSEAASPVSSHALWWAGGPRVGLEIPLFRNMTFRAYAELLFQPQTTLQIDGQDKIYRYSPLSGGIGTAVAWRFL